MSAAVCRNATAEPCRSATFCSVSAQERVLEGPAGATRSELEGQGLRSHHAVTGPGRKPRAAGGRACGLRAFLAVRGRLLLRGHVPEKDAVPAAGREGPAVGA